ncbi:hypothetical protein FQA39_LY05229 [Lamprigera yunnana]|nr:hypothetical protein FQA39_LY05229 [Lamprigera yunnana]
MAQPSLQKRIHIDIIKLITNKHQVKSLGRNEYCVKLFGPKDTAYEGGVWNVRLHLPDNYPFKSPSIGFMNRIYHPNVQEETGAVCLDVINQTWTPLYDLCNVFETFLPQLLTYPNAIDPLNPEAATTYLFDNVNFRKIVKSSIERYATIEVLTKNQNISSDSDIFVIESDQEYLASWFEESLQDVNVGDIHLNADLVTVTHEDEDRDKICDSLQGNATVIIDVTWTGNEQVKSVSDELYVPYLRVDLSISPVLDLLDKYLTLRNSSDVVVIFDDAKNVDQALYYWIDSTRLRMVVTYKLDKTAADRLKLMRPMPTAYAVIATSANLADMLSVAQYEELLRLPERWNLVFLDFAQDFSPKENISRINLLKISAKTCCKLQALARCTCQDDFNLQRTFLNLIIEQLSHVLHEIAQDDYNLSGKVSCFAEKYPNAIGREIKKRLNYTGKHSGNFQEVNHSFRLKIQATVEVDNQTIATYDDNQDLIVDENAKISSVKLFFRVGTVTEIPWAYEERDPETGKLYWTGYCIEFLHRLSELLNFDYELVVPKNGTFGKKDSRGRWNGLIGDIVSGETYMTVAPLIMTADREEVVDFVPPYFEQGGISIVMRKPVHKTSFFKFMTVLKLEVWLSVVAALVVTAFMIWFLDKYSPYSAKNNPTAYPYECRDFTLKESFWFALTSFTPQGGGEAPKSLSGRTLVAAYWLFVVLMLATFTANLAAFLTVEKMQTPVESLDQLARQSRINYTVVMNSQTHKYFINMKYAEDTLFRMWKELTLNASTDETKYRVWDYPIREQYGHILLSINESMPVANASEGFRITNERLGGDFAFIHDSAEIKYEISKNCNFSEIGEVFAEKPYAVAIQQGSYLQDPLSLAILDLQRDRFFEYLQSKYWNTSVRGECPDDFESEGITLESLGGVFITTLVGLALAMITLAGEVFYYRRKNTTDKRVKSMKTKNKKKAHIQTITIGSSFKPRQRNQITPKISHISVYPQQKFLQ